MPLPWKQTRVARISRIVADFQSPNRGGSLVVETGFPTSLIDLFVKNRGRFRKRNSKKHHPLEISDSQPPPTPSILATASLEVSPKTGRFVNGTVDEGFHGGESSGSTLTRVGECHDEFDPTPSTTTSSSKLEISAEPTYSEIPVRSLSAREIIHENADRVEFSGRVLDEMIQQNKVFVIAFNMLLVTVIMLSIEKLILGITLSAFVLVFFNFAGKNVNFCLKMKRCWHDNKELESLLQRFSGSFWLQTTEFKSTKKCEGSEEETIVHEKAIELSSASLFNGEIEMVQASNSETSSVSREDCPEIEDESRRKVLDECRTKSKRSGEFKSKMMKMLVPRKLRAFVKEKKRKKREALNSMKGHKSACFAMEEQETVIQSPVKNVKDEEKADNGTACFIDADRRKHSKGNSECFILILISLSGLVGGRTIAGLFTVVGCYMLKMMETRGTSWNLSLFGDSLRANLWVQKRSKKLCGV